MSEVPLYAAPRHARGGPCSPGTFLPPDEWLKPGPESDLTVTCMLNSLDGGITCSPGIARDRVTGNLPNLFLEIVILCTRNLRRFWPENGLRMSATSCD